MTDGTIPKLLISKLAFGEAIILSKLPWKEKKEVLIRSNSLENIAYKYPLLENSPKIPYSSPVKELVLLCFV